MAFHKVLERAQVRNKDEFYMGLSYIEDELSYYYKEDFCGKNILCNCDNPYKSNFVRFFIEHKEFNIGTLRAINYARFCGLKQFSLDGSSPRIDASEGDSEVYILEVGNSDIQSYDGDYHKFIDDHLRVVYNTEGGFDSLHGRCLLTQSDIVVTGPPFSKFREFIRVLKDWGKDFIITGTSNVVTYKDVFPMIISGKVHLGASIHAGDTEFQVPLSYSLDTKNSRVVLDKDGNIIEKFLRVPSIRWLTTMRTREHILELALKEDINSRFLEKYDNYRAINCPRTKDIPKDTDQVLGVPVTFLDKYNPEQFELIGSSDCGLVSDKYKERLALKDTTPIIKGNKVYKRLFIRHRKRLDCRELGTRGE